MDHSSIHDGSTKLSPPTKRKTGRKKFKETRHPVYKGVRRRNGKWVCEIRHPQQNNKSRIWLGTFTCPEAAGRAHDVAAVALGAEPGKLNFPESAHVLPRARSDSISDIRRAAAEVGNGDGGGDLRVAAPPLEVEVVGSTMMYVDEEEIFNMPVLLDSMAEGLIVTPPAMKRGWFWNEVVDDGDEHCMDLTLWSD
ncbi:Dehydration-responsive element-binding protein 1F [Linum perenne]